MTSEKAKKVLKRKTIFATLRQKLKRDDIKEVIERKIYSKTLKPTGKRMRKHIYFYL
jgi:hypothetical protein